MFPGVGHHRGMGVAHELGRSPPTGGRRRGVGSEWRGQERRQRCAAQCAGQSRNHLGSQGQLFPRSRQWIVLLEVSVKGSVRERLEA